MIVNLAVNRILSFIQRAPVCAGFALISIALFATIKIAEAQNPNDPFRGNSMGRQLGMVAVLELHYVVKPEKIPLSDAPYDLWDGELWRVLASGFHHGGVIHLLFNVLSLAYLGSIMEQKIGRLQFFLFFVFATYASMLAEFLVGHYAVGISGGIYAVFGALLILRKTDPEIREIIDDNLVRYGLVFFVACIGLTALDLMHIANLAHATGLVYGLFLGWILTRPSPLKVFALVTTHLLLIIPSYFVVHPVWNGRYHWNLARETDDLQQKKLHLQTAVRLSPELAHVWLSLSRLDAVRDDSMLAWKTILEGLKYNRTDKSLTKQAKDIWGSLRSKAKRKKALEVLAQSFPDEETEIWKKHLALDKTAPLNRSPHELTVRPFEKTDNQHPFMPFRDGILKQPKSLSAPDVDPDHPNSALLGEGV